jgi:hypothetical protein
MRTLLVVLLVLSALPARAYLLSGKGVVRRAAVLADEDDTRSLLAQGNATLRGASARAAAAALRLPPDDELAAHITLAYRSPGRCRVTLSPVAGGAEAAATFAGGKLDGPLASVPAIAAYLIGACELQTPRSASGDDSEGQLLRALRARGVDLGLVALRRLPGVVAYALGKDRAQAWFDQDAFRPVRVVFASGADTWDVQLLERGQPPVGDVAPRVLEVIRLGSESPELRVTLDRAERNASVAGL